MTQPKDTQELLGKVINPKELVSYQTGSVVSRTVIDKRQARAPCSHSMPGRD